jgi:cytosine/creatinine deaminase
MDLDLVLRRARLRRVGDARDIGISNGRIVGVEPSIAGAAAEQIDLDGRLVLPGFVNPHLHLDKVLFGERTGEDQAGPVEDGFRRTWAFKRAYTVEDVRDRALRVLRVALAQGTLALRMFADVDTYAELTAVRGLLAAREAFGPFMTLQLVAFPQEGIFRHPGAAALMRQALALGADVVGGLPWVEVTHDEQRQHIDLVFDLAKEYDADVHMLVDDTLDPSSRTLEYLALKTRREDYQGRVAASHCCALATYDPDHAARVIDLVKAADITIVSNAHISLVDQGQRLPEPRPRGITRVRELLQAGVNMASAQDDVDDPYYPFGKPDQLEVAWMMAHVAQLTARADLDIVLDLVTDNAARALRLRDYGVVPGARADLVVLEAASVHEALRLQAERSYVLRRGRVVARTRRETMLFLDAPAGQALHPGGHLPATPGR